MQRKVCVLSNGRQGQSVPSCEAAAAGFGGCPSSSGDRFNCKTAQSAKKSREAAKPVLLVVFHKQLQGTTISN